MKIEKTYLLLYIILISASIYFLKFYINKQASLIEYSIFYSINVNLIFLLFIAISFKRGRLKYYKKNYFMIFPMQKNNLFSIVIKSEFKIFFLLFYVFGLIFINFLFKVNFLQHLLLSALFTLNFIFLLITFLLLINYFNGEWAINSIKYLWVFIFLLFQYAQLSKKYFILFFSPFHTSFLSLVLLNDNSALIYIALINLVSIGILLYWLKQNNKSWL